MGFFLFLLNKRIIIFFLLKFDLMLYKIILIYLRVYVDFNIVF